MYPRRKDADIRIGLKKGRKATRSGAARRRKGIAREADFDDIGGVSTLNENGDATCLRSQFRALARTFASYSRYFWQILKEFKPGKALKQLAASVTLTPYEAGLYESTGTPRFEKIVRFATIDCVKAGWLAKNKGVWSITNTGKKAFDDFSDPEAFYREAIKLYREWKAGAPIKPQVESLEELNPAETAKAEASITYEKADEQAWNEIEAHLRAMPPYDMQDLVAGLLRRKGLGYHIEWVSPPGKDGGIDIIAHTDPLGTQPPRIKVQVKGGNEKIDLQTLNSFLAVVDSE